MAIKLKVIIPDGILLEREVTTAVLPGVEGDLQILPGHMPLFTPLRLGQLWLDEKGNERVAIYEGIADVAADEISVLANNAEIAEKIDVERAEQSRERAEKRLDRARTDEKIDVARAEQALKRSLLRLKTRQGGGE